MKIRNNEDVEIYPENYDNIPTQWQQVILDYLNDSQELAETYYKKHYENKADKETKEKYLNLYQHQMDLQCGAKNILSVLGIHAEYNWPDHYHEWILATKEDAQKFLDAADDPYPQCKTTEEKDDSELIEYPDIIEG